LKLENLKNNENIIDVNEIKKIEKEIRAFINSGREYRVLIGNLKTI
jgi:uncharacterized phage-like protein YoqJ